MVLERWKLTPFKVMMMMNTMTLVLWGYLKHLSIFRTEQFDRVYVWAGLVCRAAQGCITCSESSILTQIILVKRNQGHLIAVCVLKVFGLFLLRYLEYWWNYTIYPMTSVETNGERGCWKMCVFPTLSDTHSHGSWDKSKNPYSLWSHVIPILATARAP